MHLQKVSSVHGKINDSVSLVVIFQLSLPKDKSEFAFLLHRITVLKDLGQVVFSTRRTLSFNSLLTSCHHSVFNASNKIKDHHKCSM